MPELSCTIRSTTPCFPRRNGMRKPCRNCQEWYPYPRPRQHSSQQRQHTLATNLCFYNIRIDYRSERFLEGRYLVAVDSLADSLAKHFPHTRQSRMEETAYETLETEKGSVREPTSSLANISDTQYQLLRTFPFFNIPNRIRPALTREPIMRRVNPTEPGARRSIGGVGIDSITGETHGISGLERALDSLLYGTPGSRKEKCLLTKISSIGPTYLRSTAP